MMSRIPLSMAHRTVTFAVLVAFASLALPNAAHAQTLGAERALFNKTDAPFGVSEGTAAPVIDGARALLSRPGVSDAQVFQPAATSRATLKGAYRIDGQRALLGQSFGPKTAHTTSAPRN